MRTRPFVVTTALAFACNADQPPPESADAKSAEPDRTSSTKTKAPPDKESKAPPDASNEHPQDETPAPTTSSANSPHCPPSPPDGFTQCKGDTPCSYNVKCQSGTQNIAFSCNEYGNFSVGDQTCTPKFDSCPGTPLYCRTNGQWWIPSGTNPPSPCPVTPPEAGASCREGGFGGVWEKCGYPCKKADTPWMVATCTRKDPSNRRSPSTWQYDVACVE